MKSPYIELPKTALNWKHEQEEIAWPKGKPVSQCGSVYLIRQRKNSFAVIYGLQVEAELSRDRAADVFGHCVFHQAQCDGLID